MTTASSDGKEVSQLYLDHVDAYKKRFMPKNGQIAMLECYPICKNMRKRYKTIPELKAQVNSQMETWKSDATLTSAIKGSIFSL